ncbi:MAG: hypothetical protein JXA21_05755 [Anaerolineae bacterium]|nr:hypothetical protein [Anaerolineae bacterium]
MVLLGDLGDDGLEIRTCSGSDAVLSRLDLGEVRYSRKELPALEALQVREVVFNRGEIQG